VARYLFRVIEDGAARILDAESADIKGKTVRVRRHRRLVAGMQPAGQDSKKGALRLPFLHLLD
jgi:hypothetical protein